MKSVMLTLLTILLSAARSESLFPSKALPRSNCRHSGFCKGKAGSDPDFLVRKRRLWMSAMHDGCPSLLVQRD